MKTLCLKLTVSWTDSRTWAAEQFVFHHGCSTKFKFLLLDWTWSIGKVTTNGVVVAVTAVIIPEDPVCMGGNGNVYRWILYLIYHCWLIAAAAVTTALVIQGVGEWGEQFDGALIYIWGLKGERERDVAGEQTSDHMISALQFFSNC